MPIRSPYSDIQSRRSPRDLHSFPTRRSSDLVGARSVAVGAARAVEEMRRVEHEKVEPGDLDSMDRSLAALQQRVLVDRKSTRLNSSHPSISYAVFCLKKKTTDCLS